MHLPYELREISDIPWKTADGTSRVVDSHGNPVAQIEGYGADAKLIAAAPELWMALKEAIEIIESVDNAGAFGATTSRLRGVLSQAAN